MLDQILNFIFPPDRTDWDRVTEGVYADEYTDTQVREKIQQNYQQRWQTKITPATAPLKFDPLDPPRGWRYDPYYEIWIAVTA